MLQKDNRLAKIRDFNLIIKHGRRVNGRFFDLRYVELTKIKDFFPKKEDSEDFEKQLRIAIVAGLKVSKSAVKRNRVKRQAREVVRLLKKVGKIRKGYYIMVVAKAGALDKNYSEISQEIELLLNKANILVAN